MPGIRVIKMNDTCFLPSRSWWSKICMKNMDTIQYGKCSAKLCPTCWGAQRRVWDILKILFGFFHPPLFSHCHFLIYLVHACMHAQSFQACPPLSNPVDCSPPGSSVHGILQARILEWTAMPSSRWSSQPRNQTHISYVSCIAGRFFIAEPLGKPDIPGIPTLTNPSLFL